MDDGTGKFMNKFLRILIGLMVIASCFGCVSADQNKTGRTNAAGHPEELRDSTRLDPAADAVDTVRAKPDSL